MIPGGTKAVAGEATGKTITAGHTICGSTESRTKAKTAGSETKRLDLGGNVKAHRQESLHAPGPAVQEGGQETASSTLPRWSCAKLAVIAFVSCLLSAFPYCGSRRVETLLSMSLHVSAEIQTFHFASRGFGLGTALRRAANSVSGRDGFSGGLTGHRFRPPRYHFVSDRGALGKQPMTMSWSELCRGSRTETFLKIWRSVPRM